MGDRFEALSIDTRADLVLTLVEASRLPNMAWKRFVIRQAEIASRGLGDGHIDCRISQARSLLDRVAGNPSHSNEPIGSGESQPAHEPLDNRMHAALGQARIQRSLDAIQVEDLAHAKALLGGWKPSGQSPSALEATVVFRKHMLLGRALRFQGAFEESLVHFELAWAITRECDGVLFTEDLRDLVCDHADALRELDRPAEAERLLRTEIGRQARVSGASLLELSLAEVLFAQDRLQETEQLCSGIEGRSGLLKFERLRLHIIVAKTRHIKSDFEGALSHWSAAMKHIGKFQLTNGRATRIIVLSICDSLGGLGQTWLVEESMKQVASLDQICKPGGAHSWIAGMRHWLLFLESRGQSSG